MGIAKIVPLETHADERGRLTTLSLVDGCVPFTVKRMFYIYDVPLRVMRGGHAHKTCEQFLIAVSGMVLLNMDNGVEHVLSVRSVGLYIPAGNVVRMLFLTPDACLLVLASELYDKDDYIYDTGDKP
jgi:dTDP-4-dehydrorhamnose 3,5-epimerase-like enzyme